MDNVIIAISLIYVVAMLAAGLWLVRLGCRVSSGFTPSWSSAGWSVFLCLLASLPMPIIERLTIGGKTAGIAIVATLAVAVSAFILSKTLKHPERGAIGFKNGVIVALVWGGGGLVIATLSGIAVSMLVQSIDQPNERQYSYEEATGSAKQQAGRGPSNSDEEDHIRAIYDAHPDANSIVVSDDFAKWRSAQSHQDQEAISRILGGGTVVEIINMLDIYKSDMRSQQNVSPPVEVKRDVRHYAGQAQADEAQMAFQLYPYLNDVAGENKWSGPFRAWLREFSAIGEPYPAIEAARVVDTFRVEGYGACYPRPGTIERGDCN